MYFALNFMDYLWNVGHKVTETTHDVYNDVVDISYTNIDLLLKYFANLQNFSLTDMFNWSESSLPLPNIGWNVPE